MKAILFFITLFFVLVNNCGAQSRKITPAHVYQKAVELTREIQLIRKKKQITTSVRTPGVQSKKAPIHVFGKSLEVLYKISRLKMELGLQVFQVQYIPIRQIPPALVYQSIQKALREEKKIKEKLNIEEKIQPVSFIKGKQPSDVYEQLWIASYLLDTLGKPLSPSHVYRNTLYILSELKAISSHLGKSFIQKTDITQLNYKITPKDVLIESYKNLYRLAKLEIQLKIPPFTPSSFPTGNIIPSDPYDATSTLISDLVRVKVKLGITVTPEQLKLPTNKTPLDVFNNVQLIGKNLENLLRK
ncbi:MAG: hypothetical protein ACI86H_001178 [bacterium]|jgi:hypothetical protein